MLSFLKNHPFAVEAFFERSTVLTFAAPKEQLQRFIPECLELDTLNDKYGFVAVAMVQTKSLRPKGFPAFLGNNFFLIGYRIFVRYTTNTGKRLRSLYILKSETDKKKMEYLGNIFTHYSYSTTDIQQINSATALVIESQRSDFRLEVDVNTDDVALPENSPFANWKEARRFAGPLPFTFSYNAITKDVTIIQGVRENWQPKPIKVSLYNIGFLNSLSIEDIRLANAFTLTNIPYYWKKGRVEKWKG